MLRNAAQNTQLHALIGKLGIGKETKEDLVYQYTAGRECSSSKMTVAECQALINHLNVLAKGKSDVTDKQRKKILSICHEMNWRTENGKVDFARLKEYLLKYGYLHKELNNYTDKEIPKLVTQFENLLKHYYAGR